MFRESFVLVVFAALSAASVCDSPNPQFGVGLREDGVPTIQFKPCNSDARVFDLYAEQSGSDSVLWHVTSDEGSLAREFALGQTPGGFREVVPLTRALPDRIVVALTTERSGREKNSVAAEWVDLQELRPDEILVPLRGRMTLEKFEKYRSCD